VVEFCLGYLEGRMTGEFQEGLHYTIVACGYEKI
jgi:hypothetical protein